WWLKAGPQPEPPTRAFDPGLMKIDPQPEPPRAILIGLLRPRVSVRGSTLTVQGTAGGDRIRILARGDGRLQASAGGEKRLVRGVSDVFVRTGGGNDSVAWQMTAGRARDLTVNVDLGAGRDQLRANLAGNLLGRWTLNAEGGGGRDAVAVSHVGRI